MSKVLHLTTDANKEPLFLGVNSVFAVSLKLFR